MDIKKELKVSAIKNGTVIDHIPSPSLFKVITILGLDKTEHQVTFGTNLESRQLGTKAIIKVTDIFFKDDEINKIALVAPDAKLNIIKDYYVVEKKVVNVPDNVLGLAKCMNPQCITNNEEMLPRFEVTQKKPVALKCEYCEKITDSQHLEII
ncbi:MAG: aspartate carbamoyltransferase regulatory subunit [Bacteroidota bacterium]|nr:aspartate carbamoyltransferase regulatory subunit [Bacteroidota bacterium]